MKFLNLTNHIPTQDMINLAAGDGLEFVELPSELKALWGSIPQTGVREHITPVMEYLATFSGEVLLTGEPRACHIVASSIGTDRCRTSFSARESVDEVQADGSVLKKAIFRIKGFPRYE